MEISGRVPTPLKMELFQEQQPQQWCLMESEGPAAPCAVTEFVPGPWISFLCSQPRSRDRLEVAPGRKKEPLRNTLMGSLRKGLRSPEVAAWTFGEGSISEGALSLESVGQDTVLALSASVLQYDFPEPQGE